VYDCMLEEMRSSGKIGEEVCRVESLIEDPDAPDSMRLQRLVVCTPAVAPTVTQSNRGVHPAFRRPPGAPSGLAHHADVQAAAVQMPDVDPIFGLESGAQGGLMHYADNPDNRSR